jgi:uncharacterized protein YjbJ (UPF0337 family)
MGKTLGRVKELLGYATGDREVEARGRVEQRVGDPAAPLTEINDDLIADEKHHVRSELGDVQSDAEKQSYPPCRGRMPAAAPSMRKNHQLR